MSLHVTPTNDAIAHDSNPDCVCDPDLRDGVWVHHSLDGRERLEQAKQGEEQ